MLIIGVSVISTNGYSGGPAVVDRINEYLFSLNSSQKFVLTQLCVLTVRSLNSTLNLMILTLLFVRYSFLKTSVGG